MPLRSIRLPVLIGAALLVLSPVSLESGRMTLPPAFADDDGGGGEGGRAGRSRGGAIGGRTVTPRRQRANCDFNLPFFRCKAKAQRSTRRTRQARPAAATALLTNAPNELVATGLTEQDLTALTTSGFAVLDRRELRFPPRLLVRLRIPRGERPDSARSQVAALNSAGTVDLNHFYRPQAQSCAGRNCASLALVSWPARLSLSCGALPTLGMIDTGVNLKHPALRDQDIEVAALDEKRPSSSQRHGTAIATLLVGAPGGEEPGLLPAAKLIAVDSFQDSRSDTRMAAFDLIRAFDLMIGRGVAVLNMSFTGPANRLLEAVVNEALQRNVALVAAAGNSGPRAKPLYPAAYDGVIAVTALDQKMTVYRRAVQGDHIDFAAPGVNVWTAAAANGWGKKSGTSIATPFVTAAAALTLAGDPALKGSQIAEAMSRSVKDLGKPGRDPVYGWGLIQATAICPSREFVDTVRRAHYGPRPSPNRNSTYESP